MGFGVAEGDGVLVGVTGVGVLLGVGEGPGVIVGVLLGVGVFVGVLVGVGDGVRVGVFVGVELGVNDAAAPQTTVATAEIGPGTV